MTAEPFALTHPGLDARSREADHADREDDPTPRGVVRAALAAAELVQVFEFCNRFWVAGDSEHEPIGRMGGAPARVLDVCAGYGCWASELRRLAGLQGWPVHITGVELFEPRRADLAKWCDETIMGDWREAMCAIEDTEDGAVDIAIGNPHFTALTHEDPEQSMPAVLLRHAPAALLLHTQQAFARGAAGRRVWRRYTPAASWVIPGAVGFRGPGQGTDSRCYQASLWLRGHEGPTALHMLPELDAAARRWTDPPGSEDPSEDLPASPSFYELNKPEPRQ